MSMKPEDPGLLIIAALGHARYLLEHAVNTQGPNRSKTSRLGSRTATPTRQSLPEVLASVGCKGPFADRGAAAPLQCGSAI